MDEFKVNVNTNPGPAPDTEAPVTPAPETVITPMDVDPFKPDAAPVQPPDSHKSKGKSGKGKTPLIILLVLLLIGGTAYGVYYWQQKQVKDAQAQVTTLNTKAADLSKQLATAQAATAKATDTKTAVTTNVFKIPELSIEMTVADSIKDLNYTLRNNKYDDGTPFIIADISSKTITDLDKNCASTATPPFGGLTRTDGTAPKAQATQTSQPVALKQFPNFYIGKASSQANCSTNKTVQDKITQLQKDYATALGTIVLVK